MRVSSDAEAALARAWIAAQDDLDDPARMDSVHVAADRLQAKGNPLGEIVTLGLALLEHGGSAVHANLQAAYLDRVSALLPEVLGPFASLITHPQAFSMRWSLCYLEEVRLPVHQAPGYAGLLGYKRLEPAEMLARFLSLPAARCLRSLTIDVGYSLEHLARVLEAVAQCRAPIETVILWGSFSGERAPLPASIVAMPYLHTLVLQAHAYGGQEPVPLPGGDPNVPWRGEASSIRALGRAVTGRDSSMREQALARIGRMGRNSGRYVSAVRALDVLQRDPVRIDRAALLAYAQEASSLEHQRAQYQLDGNHPRWALASRWRAMFGYGARFRHDSLNRVLREHDKMHRARGLEPLSFEDMLDDPHWVEFRRQAEEIGRLVTIRIRTWV